MKTQWNLKANHNEIQWNYNEIQSNYNKIQSNSTKTHNEIHNEPGGRVD